MRITRFLDDSGRILFGLDRGDGSAERLAGPSAGDPLAGQPEPTGEIVPVTRRLAPVQPPTIFCIGLNYADHAKEGGTQVPDYPCIFMKPITTLNHPGQPIVIPASSHGPEVDYEAELAVVIGKTARNVSEDNALDHVLGYTCANDISARWWQKHGGGGQWVRGKGFDTFCPLGPVLVTPGIPGTPGTSGTSGGDEIPDPQALRIRSVLNGQTMQDDTTANMMFSVRHLIAHLSRDTTLLPGTVILTGTPAGVGHARKPPVFLQPGDTIEITIDGIGTLSNPITTPQ